MQSPQFTVADWKRLWWSKCRIVILCVARRFSYDVFLGSLNCERLIPSYSTRQTHKYNFPLLYQFISQLLCFVSSRNPLNSPNVSQTLFLTKSREFPQICVECFPIEKVDFCLV
jgi:hypothetical protein